MGWAPVNTTATAALSATGFIQCVQSHEEGADASDEHHHTVLVHAGDVVTTLADVSTGHIYFAVNGNWQQQHQQLLSNADNNSSSTGDSSTTATAATAAVPLRPLLTTARGDASSKAVVNFGAVPFKHVPPTDNARFTGWQAVVERPDVASHWPTVTAPSVTEQSVSAAPAAATAAAVDVLPPLSLSRGSSPTTATATASATGSSNSGSSCLTPPRGSALNTAP
eukprot:4347-Heterococcus_DN1.PRE.1